MQLQSYLYLTICYFNLFPQLPFKKNLRGKEVAIANRIKVLKMICFVIQKTLRSGSRISKLLEATTNYCISWAASWPDASQISITSAISCGYEHPTASREEHVVWLLQWSWRCAAAVTNPLMAKSSHQSNCRKTIATDGICRLNILAFSSKFR